MKKILFVFFAVCIICIPLSVNAASVSISLSCPNSAKASSIVSCTINTTPSGSDLKGIQSNIKINGGSYSSFTIGNGWTAYSNSVSGFSLGRNTAVSKTVTVGTLKVKMPSSGSVTVSLTNVAGSDSNYATLSGNSPSKTIRVQSDVNKLSSLSLSKGSLSPTFNSNTTSYTATVDDSSITIKGSVTDSKSKVSGLGTKKLSYGKNTFSIVVTSESGKKRTYSVIVTRPDNRSSNNNLKSLSIDKGNISFNKNTTSYKVNVNSDVASIKISATVGDSKAGFVSGSGPRSVNLKYGDNKIQIKVKAENGDIKTYTLTVNRKDNRSSDSKLSSLSILPVEINFDKNITTYNSIVPYDISSVKLSYAANDSKAKVEIVGKENLIVGNNKIVVKVTAENETVTNYTLNIVRQKENERVLNSDSSLKELNVNGQKVSLNASKTYVIELDKEVVPNIKAVAKETTSKVSVSQIDKLKDGSIITIMVTAEDGSSSTYLVSTIVKENSSLFIIIITFVITQLANIIVYKFLLKKKTN